MTPTKREVTEALAKVDREISFIETTPHMTERSRQQRLSDWCGVRKVITDLLWDVATMEGKL